MLKQMGFLLDANRCLGCGACVKACQANNHLPATLSWRWITKMEDETDDGIRRFFLSVACNHCSNPECLRACSIGAYAKRRDGIVIHNHEKCTGCKSCVAACPFGAITINPDTGKASKCKMCYSRVDHGRAPFCVKACVTGALVQQEIQNTVLNELVRLTAPATSLRLTQPSVFYNQPYRLKLNFCRQG